MMGACGASYNALKKCFPNAKILMCYFHVKLNCKKNYKDCGLTNQDWNIVESDIDHLHTCLNAEEFKIKTAETLQK